MPADARIEADALDDLATVHATGQRVAVELVEEGHPHGEIGVREKLDRLGLVGIGEQHLDVLAFGPLQQQVGKDPRPLRALAHDDARGVQVVVERPAFAQELGAEDHLVGFHLAPDVAHVAHRDGGFDDDGGARVHRDHLRDHRLDAGCVEVVGLGIVVGRGCDDDVIGLDIGLLGTGGGSQIKRAVGKEVLDLGIDDRALAVVDQFDPLFGDVECRDRVALRQQYGVREADVAQACNSNLHT